MCPLSVFSLVGHSIQLSRAEVLLLVAMFLLGVSEIVHPLESLRDKYMPSTKRLPIVLYQHDAASLSLQF